jgi:hypothetical protein
MHGRANQSAKSVFSGNFIHNFPINQNTFPLPGINPMENIIKKKYERDLCVYTSITSEAYFVLVLRYIRGL